MKSFVSMRLPIERRGLLMDPMFVGDGVVTARA
jgi:hypothetical protein